MRVGFYLVKDRPRRVRTFMRAARWWRQQCYGDEVRMFAFAEGQDVLAVLEDFPDDSLEQVAFFCHGISYALGRPGRLGFDVRPKRYSPPEICAHTELAEVLARKMKQGGLVSLCACLCSRSPRWRIRQLFGRILDPWSPQSYKDGGDASFSSRLCRTIDRIGKRVQVRGHVAAGHTINLALLRQHEGDEAVGRALFQMVHGTGTKPTLRLRRQWNRIVRGRLAARWLLGLCEVDDVRRTLQR